MQSLYTPDTFAGDEDTGSMSAWFVLSALGFYPVCPGKPEYTLGSPLFARAVVHVPGGVTFTIEASGNTPDAVFVHRASLDGKAVAGSLLDHAAIMKGGTLRFEMTSSAKPGGNAQNSA
jgi:putative alpha-1,2-mannosidase